MQDREIVELYLKREESALEKTAEKYKNYCVSIAERILGNREDAEEIWNDVLSAAWNLIPPNEPEHLNLYLGKIARNAALKKLESERAKKRCGIKIQLEELAECIPAPLFEQQADIIALREFLNAFLAKLPKEQRSIFIKRYWLCEEVKSIANMFGYSENKVSMILFRIRKRLKKELEKEELNL
ncbi:MAG: sigma-70 family RNA polymerase sigma factor [Oscillospiraceae bacterium]|nr:sigma-70 family RNA polymerase sigma factor [Oscillospiraceae bacterium]